MAAPFPTSRDDEFGIVKWAQSKMSRPLRVIEEHGEELAQVGVDSVRATIQGFGRIDPDHDEAKDGPEQMIEGVRGEVTGSTKENMVNIKVGWDLTQYRDGYPELQDRGFQGVVGMEALTLAKIAMATAAQRLINNDKGD